MLKTFKAYYPMLPPFKKTISEEDDSKPFILCLVSFEHNGKIKPIDLGRLNSFSPSTGFKTVEEVKDFIRGYKIKKIEALEKEIDKVKDWEIDKIEITV